MDLLTLGDEHVVSLTTFRRSGEAVSTPVRIGRDGEQLVVLTPDGTGKTKRLRHTHAVVLRPCDRRGRVAPGAPSVRATARVDRDPALLARTRAILAAKHRLEFHGFMLVERLVRRRSPARVVITVHPRSG
ncbi:PPOX class F420-dependent oxidoreductase [Arsenicicoccus dermatophilus]|uniref:PPOX class F420-dependent oxidoreductase n=1 Tax=Arsenicicoccus dermatophilus TaxID=1076331 RepID=UPI001F4CD96A|nr:PPOX class F420-dependent oxidoreductase [Arsenicicoccus dermatophilus]MCH8612177.1 PPOX class F420-dependent oxidoreductase [Arsenicicoccus dermatophilus]